MSIQQRGAVLSQIQRLFEVGTASGLSEWQLLRRYLACGDDAAFETLVARHGPMVLGVCRRMLSNPDDVEDAFQATFLVLVRRARGLGERDAIGPWLYGVASRVALRARCEAARRGTLEKPLPEVPTQDAEAIRRELGPILDEELSRLPSKYRAPIVLCYLEGETHDEAARRLGWPLGTVKGRLVRARELLKGRLVRRGLTLSAGSLVASLSREAAATVPDPLRDATVRAAIKVSSGRGAVEAVGAAAAALAERALKIMLLNKLTASGLVLLVCAMVAVGAGAVMSTTAADEPEKLAAQAALPDSGKAEGEPRETPGSGPIAKEKSARESTGPATAASPAVEAAPRDEVPGKAARAVLLRAFHEALAAYRDGKVDVDKVYDWSKRLLTVEDSYANGSDRRPAFQAHLDRMGQLRHEVGLRAAKGKEPALTLTAAEYFKQEAADQLKDVASTSTPSSGPAAARPAPAAVAAATAAPVAGPPAQGPFPPQTGAGLEPGKDPRSLAILDALDKPIEMQFANETPLEDVLKYIKSATKGPDFPDGITIFVDPIGLQEAEKTLTSPIMLDLTGVPLKRTLHLLLRQLGLAYFVEDGMVYITAEGASENGHLPNPMMTPSPLMEAKQKAARGELSSIEMKELIEKLKALRELETLQSFKDETTAPPGKPLQ